MLVGELPPEIRELHHLLWNYADKYNLSFEEAVSEVTRLSREFQDSQEEQSQEGPSNLLAYTGVGSREVSDEEFDLMEAVAKWLAGQGYVLRSGKALGSDSAFESGVNLAGDISKKEIYTPWEKFNGNELEGETIPLGKPSTVDFGISLKLVREIHPAADRLSQGALKLHQRNCHQVLGKSLENPIPSRFLLACGKEDKDGNVQGGTRTAWMLAKKYGVPCLNIRGKTKKEIFAFLKQVM